MHASCSLIGVVVRRLITAMGVRMQAMESQLAEASQLPAQITRQSKSALSHSISAALAVYLAAQPHGAT